MTENTKYEKPTITFCDLRLDRAIADPCWSSSVRDNTYYYDVDGSEGTKYVSFQIAITEGNKGSCGTPTAINCAYYTSKTATADYTTGATYAAAITTAIKSSGGNGGQPFNSAGFTYSSIKEPDAPPIQNVS